MKHATAYARCYWIKGMLEFFKNNTRRTWNMDNTVTGSVADMRAPNIRHSTRGSLYMRKVKPPRNL